VNDTLDNIIDNKKIYNILIDSLDNISNILKSAGNSIRLKILAELLLSPKLFSFFLDTTQLKKTSLIHHISSLINSGLIKRTQRGLYKISIDGIDFVKNIVLTYQRSHMKLQIEQDYISEQFKYNRLPLSPLGKMVGSNPIYQGGWNSYISSVSGILMSLGMKYNYIHVGGQSGYSFITNIQKGWISFLAESLLSDTAWDLIQKGTEDFGWNIINVRIKMKNPRSRKLVEEDLKLAEEIFEKIKQLIQIDDTPVIMWGLRVPAYGIIRGYQKDSYLVSTYFRLFGKEDTPIKYDELQPLDIFHYFYFKDRFSNNENRDINKDSLKRAILFAKGINVAKSNFVAGPDAYSEWSNILENYHLNNFNIFGNSFLAKFYNDAKNTCSEYLDWLSNSTPNQSSKKFLNQANKHYRKIKHNLEEYSELFPYFEQDSNILNNKTVDQGISLLDTAKSNELKAIEYMEYALDNWD